MRVLVAHVRYRNPGGEDKVFDQEVGLLRQGGCDVEVLDLKSSRFESLGPLRRTEIGIGAGDHAFGRRLLSDALAHFEPQVVHFHNLYPLLGSGAMIEAQQRGIPTVRTLHNYRLSCIAGTHLRRGRVCEACSQRRHIPGVVAGCYRGSRLQSAAMASACTTEWTAMLRRQTPTLQICLSDFARQRLIASGADPMRVIVKPNSVDASVQATRPRKGALFVGRLSNEKGIRELVGAWPAGADPIRVVGDGPLAGELRDLAKHNVLILGARSRNEIRVLLSTSRVLVVPSLWYEGLPLAVLEAASEGTPVVSFRLGAMEEVVGSVAESCLASPGDVSALISVALGICHASELVWGDLSARFRAAYEAQYTHAANLESLLGTYALALRIGAAGSPLSAKQKRASAKG